MENEDYRVWCERRKKEWKGWKEKTENDLEKLILGDSLRIISI